MELWFPGNKVLLFGLFRSLTGIVTPLMLRFWSCRGGRRLPRAFHPNCQDGTYADRNFGAFQLAMSRYLNAGELRVS